LEAFQTILLYSKRVWTTAHSAGERLFMQQGEY
jgi:hypothetical protein